MYVLLKEGKDKLKKMSVGDDKCRLQPDPNNPDKKIRCNLIRDYIFVFMKKKTLKARWISRDYAFNP